MKIAITADIHLTSRKKYPQRWNALANIFDNMLSKDIKNLIIAGDLFDKESQNYSEFDQLCKQEKYSDANIKLYIIPGNHDASIKAGHFTSKNIKIINEPEIIKFGQQDINFFFIPYIAGKSIGEIIAEYQHRLSEYWVLIGHGDYIPGLREPNPYEPGIYMPLTRNDVEYYTPAIVILGHIHKGMNLGKIYYPGSPCGLDINETGRRNFFTLDTNTLEIEDRVVDTDYLFFNENIVVLPVENEFDYMEKKILDMIEGWNITEQEVHKVRMRLKVKGYTTNKPKLLKVIKQTLKDYAFYNNEEPNLDEVSLFDDPERIGIVEKVMEEIESLNWDDGITQKEDILEQALHIILKEQ
jgi:DNA repair protein SbcD/Mre11